ncbi:hypothetical protein GNI_011070 [Gregarina niphandrodes]|uniref:Uncharacterized protein n=1 Tax=Gregarina niphandrodes TaxID=110365 RepID=A0A023BCY0_GRENI|nr:hypothetical protein GNI_011070 [Gregarina niphandrodes]EZG86040.1 hypothetical protein GNI_011070 [Gregarina niphandrodes]|eukprot:XP_011128795.1 hypothetical protein GNI_011070 [Gregarina niphandrodes]
MTRKCCGGQFNRTPHNSMNTEPETIVLRSTLPKPAPRWADLSTRAKLEAAPSGAPSAAPSPAASGKQQLLHPVLQVLNQLERNHPQESDTISGIKQHLRSYVEQDGDATPASIFGARSAPSAFRPLTPPDLARQLAPTQEASPVSLSDVTSIDLDGHEPNWVMDGAGCDDFLEPILKVVRNLASVLGSSLNITGRKEDKAISVTHNHSEAASCNPGCWAFEIPANHHDYIPEKCAPQRCPPAPCPSAPTKTNQLLSNVHPQGYRTTVRIPL